MSEYTIIGCPESTDLDIVVVCSSLDETIAISCTRQKKIDCNKIIVENGVVTKVEKGTATDTHAIIYYTQNLHPENTSFISLLEPRPPCVADRKRSLIKFIFDRLEQLTDKSTYKNVLRPTKIEIYTKTNEDKMSFIKTIFEVIKEHNYTANDTYKTFVMKAVQYMLLCYKVECCSDFFTKQGLLRLMSIYVSNYILESIRYYLYRGKQGEHKKEGLSLFLDNLFSMLQA